MAETMTCTPPGATAGLMPEQAIACVHPSILQASHCFCASTTPEVPLSIWPLTCVQGWTAFPSGSDSSAGPAVNPKWATSRNRAMKRISTNVLRECCTLALPNRSPM